MAGRRLGQHFLASRSTLEKIAQAACSVSEAPVVEIGPGKGALTQLLLQHSPRVISIEIDPVLVHYLREKFRGHTNFELIHQNVLKADLRQWGPVTVAGNLPYYITSPIVEKVLAMRDQLRLAVFLVQKEVALRMAAGPGTKDYGYLSTMVQVLAEPRVLFNVPPEAFRPSPKVDSAVIELRPRLLDAIPDTDKFLQFTASAFKQKRKTLRNNLTGLYSREAIEAQPEASLRAEQLSLRELAGLHQRILNF